jgi:hypothetical protein
MAHRELFHRGDHIRQRFLVLCGAICVAISVMKDIARQFGQLEFSRRACAQPDPAAPSPRSEQRPRA